MIKRTLPSELGPFTYAPDGGALYGFLRQNENLQPGIAKIEVDSMKVTLVTGTTGIRLIHELTAVSGGKLFVSGGYSDNAMPLSCGIFEVSLATGDVRKVVANSSCDLPKSWVNLSVSSDGAKIIAYRDHELYVLDGETGAIVRRLGTKFYKGLWSPDGRRIAAVDSTGSYGVRILDAGSFQEKRVLEGIRGLDLAWSPDSRHLLGLRYGLCLYYYTFVVADVDSGAASTIWSSWCKINRTTSGWLKN